MNQPTDVEGSPPTTRFWICLGAVAAIALATPFAIGIGLGFYKEETEILKHLPRLPVYAMLTGAYVATATALTLAIIGILRSDSAGNPARPMLSPAAQGLLAILGAVAALIVIVTEILGVPIGGALSAQLSTYFVTANATVLDGISKAGNVVAFIAVTAFAVGCVELMNRSARAGLAALPGLVRNTNQLLYGASFLLAVGVLTVFTFFTLPVQEAGQLAPLDRARTAAIAASLLFSTILLLFAVPLIALQQRRIHKLVDERMKEPGAEREKLLKNHGLSETNAYQTLAQGLATIAPILAAFLGIATK